MVPSVTIVATRASDGRHVAEMLDSPFMPAMGEPMSARDLAVSLREQAQRVGARTTAGLLLTSQAGRVTRWDDGSRVTLRRALVTESIVPRRAR